MILSFGKKKGKKKGTVKKMPLPLGKQRWRMRIRNMEGNVLIPERINHFFDQLAIPWISIFHGNLSSYKFCGYIGLTLVGREKGTDKKMKKEKTETEVEVEEVASFGQFINAFSDFQPQRTQS